MSAQRIWSKRLIIVHGFRPKTGTFDSVPPQLLFTHPCSMSSAIADRQVLQLELRHLGLVEVVSQLQAVLGQTDASRPGQGSRFIVCTQHLDVLRARHKGLGERLCVCVCV